MTTLIELQKELEPYKDTLILEYFEVVKLIDVVDDEEDFYWVVDTPKGIRKFYCLVRWSPLKGILPDKDYNELVRVWNLNNIEPAI